VWPWCSVAMCCSSVAPYIDRSLLQKSVLHECVPVMRLHIVAGLICKRALQHGVLFAGYVLGKCGICIYNII